MQKFHYLFILEEIIGENGRKFVIENFSWDVVTQKFILDLKKFF